MIKEIIDFCGPYSVKKMTKYESRNGYGWSCDLYENNVLVGTIEDRGNGGAPYLYIADKEALERLTQYATSKGFDFEPEGNFVAQINDYMDNIKRIKTQCKKKTLVIFKDDKEMDQYGVHTSYNVLNAEFNEDTKAKFLKLNPNVSVFINEELTLLDKPKVTKTNGKKIK